MIHVTLNVRKSFNGTMSNQAVSLALLTHPLVMAVILARYNVGHGVVHTGKFITNL